jgi:hypothetical protein
MSQRFVYRPLIAERMANIGQAVIDTVVKPRIARAVNMADQSAKPLKPGRVVKGRQLKGYPEYKIARGRAPIRDLFWRGMTMRSLRVVDATANKVKIGFDNPQASRIAAISQRREEMFWFSPADQQKIGEIVRDEIRNAEMVGFRQKGLA